ncbi:reverse transcriptase-like protein [Bacillus massiliglaciei]|uniref:reverse transcriptase-like protein n=1 Tax=Bacillus massiliglaciei TaxID=1816693 RepID=UPI000DA61339|nr:reverse transcriptase-like protein [Bacillus massiliglaciei]
MKVMMEWSYRLPKKPSAEFTSGWMEAEDALTVTEDLEKSGRLKNVAYIDEQGASWTKKELKKLIIEIEDEPKNVTVFFDGGYRKEEGMAGTGIALYYQMGNKQYRIRANARYENLESNNEAEYAAFFEGVKQLEELGVRHQRCQFKGDSLVVLNQLSGEWPCLEETLNKWIDRIEQKLDQLSIKADYISVDRKGNQEAHQLASQALKGEEILSRLEII